MEIALALAITIAVLAFIIVIILAVILYHQMLLINEVNKRLLLMTKESIEKERLTMEELQDMIHVNMDQGPVPPVVKEGEEPGALGDAPFDPHEYEENLQ